MSSRPLVVIQRASECPSLPSNLHVTKTTDDFPNIISGISDVAPMTKWELSHPDLGLDFPPWKQPQNAQNLAQRPWNRPTLGRQHRTETATRLGHSEPARDVGFQG